MSTNIRSSWRLIGPSNEKCKMNTILAWFNLTVDPWKEQHWRAFLNYRETLEIIYLPVSSSQSMRKVRGIEKLWAWSGLYTLTSTKQLPKLVTYSSCSPTMSPKKLSLLSRSWPRRRPFWTDWPFLSTHPTSKITLNSTWLPTNWKMLSRTNLMIFKRKGWKFREK